MTDFNLSDSFPLHLMYDKRSTLCMTMGWMKSSFSMNQEWRRRQVLGTSIAICGILSVTFGEFSRKLFVSSLKPVLCLCAYLSYTIMTGILEPIGYISISPWCIGYCAVSNILRFASRPLILYRNFNIGSKANSLNLHNPFICICHCPSVCPSVSLSDVFF